MNLPIYKVVYDINDNLEEEGVYGISIVDNPANKMEYIALSEFEEIKLTTSDKEKQLLTGVVLIPNQKILRKHSQTGELYELLFEADTIEKVSQDFFRKGKQRNATYNHLDTVWLNGTTVVESWIIEDPNNDKANALGFKNLPKGTWMISMKLTDELWKEYVKTGKTRGFSIDSYIQMEKIQMASTPPFHEFCKCELVDGKIKTDGTPCEYCQEQINKLNLNKQTMKQEKTGVLASLAKFFSAIKQEVEKSTIEIEGIGSISAEAWEEGNIVYFQEDGELKPLKTSSFNYEGFTFTTDEDGKIVDKAEFIEEVTMAEEDKNVEDEVKEEEEVEMEATEGEEASIDAQESALEIAEELAAPVEEIDVKALQAKIAELEAQLQVIMKEKEMVVMENMELSKLPVSTRLKAIIDTKGSKQESTVEVLARIVKQNKQ